MLWLLLFALAQQMWCSDGVQQFAKFNPKTYQLEWPDRYYVDGYLMLPYAELAEPFTAWYDKQTGKSRVDMYGGKRSFTCSHTCWSVQYTLLFL